MEDFILSIMPIINGQYFHVETISFNPSFEFENSNNYIFIQNIPEHLINKVSFSNVYVFNTEQLSDSYHLNTLIKIVSNNKLINYIDYSNGNLKYGNALEFNKKFFFPYQINLSEILNINKNKDICLVGRFTDYRKNIVNLLKDKNIIVNLVSGFGRQRDSQLFQYKILLNIGQTNYFNIFESIRCDRCIYNKMIVISDFKEDMDKHYLKDYIIFEKYENIPDKVIDVLNNYDYYYDKLYKNFDFDKIEKIINENSKEILEVLNN
jgi:hypothetical protein